MPRGTVAGSSLVAVIAIMTFLAGVAAGAVEIVRVAASEWHADVAREVTIQVRPIEGRDIEAEIGKAVDLARRTSSWCGSPTSAKRILQACGER